MYVLNRHVLKNTSFVSDSLYKKYTNFRLKFYGQKKLLKAIWAKRSKAFYLPLLGEMLI